MLATSVSEDKTINSTCYNTDSTYNTLNDADNNITQSAIIDSNIRHSAIIESK